MMSHAPYNTHLEEVINHTKLDYCMPTRLHTHTYSKNSAL